MWFEFGNEERKKEYPDVHEVRQHLSYENYGYFSFAPLPGRMMGEKNIYEINGT